MGRLQGTVTLELADFILINEQQNHHDEKVEKLQKEIEDNHKFISEKVEKLEYDIIELKNIINVCIPTDEYF